MAIEAAAGAMAQAAGSIGSFIGTLMKGSMPQYKPVDLAGAAGQAVNFNRENLAGFEGTAANVNAFNQDQVLKMLKTAIPDYENLMKQQGDVIKSELSGELPKGVLEQLQNQSAAYGVASGTKGSQFAGYRGLRQLGLNSLQMMQQGISSADQWLKTAHQMTQAPIMDVTSMFINPMQAANFVASEHTKAYENELGAWMQPNALQAAGATLAGVGGSFAGSNGFGMFGNQNVGGGGYGGGFGGYGSGLSWQPQGNSTNIDLGGDTSFGSNMG